MRKRTGLSIACVLGLASSAALAARAGEKPPGPAKPAAKAAPGMTELQKNAAKVLERRRENARRAAIVRGRRRAAEAQEREAQRQFELKMAPILQRQMQAMDAAQRENFRLWMLERQTAAMQSIAGSVRQEAINDTWRLYREYQQQYTSPLVPQP